MALVLILIWVVARAGAGEQLVPRLWAAKGGLLALAGFSLFSYPTQILPIMLAGTVCLGACGTASRCLRRVKLSWGTAVKIVGTVVVAALLGGAALGICRWNRAARTWKRALSAYYCKDYARSLRRYKAGMPALRTNGKFLANYGKALSMAHRDSAAVKVLRRAVRYHDNAIVQTAMGDSYRRLGQYRPAEAAFRRAGHMQPSHFYPFYLLARLYEATGGHTQAAALARRLIRKTPKVPSRAVRQMKRKMKALLGDGAAGKDRQR